MKRNRMAKAAALLLAGSMLAGCGAASDKAAVQETAEQTADIAVQERAGSAGMSENSEAAGSAGTPENPEAAGSAGMSENLETESSAETLENAETAHLTVEVFDREDMPAGYGTPADNRWTRLIQETVKEELNIDLEFVAVERSEETTKIDLLLAAGQEPDIFMTYYADKFTAWAGNGSLADLAPYLDEEGQDLKEYLEEVLPYGQTGDAQFALNGRRLELGSQGTFIRRDWLEKLGIKVQERNGVPGMTPSELLDALVQMKEAGFCEYPMGMIGKDDTGLSILPLICSFLEDEALKDEENRALLERDAKYIAAAGAKEGYRFLNQCYHAGLFNPDFPLYGESDLEEWIASGQCGFWAANPWSYLEADQGVPTLYKADPEAEVMAIEICREDGSPANRLCYSPKGAYVMVSANCEDVAAAVRYLNWLVSEEAHLLIWHGLEGEHWQYDEDQVITPIDTEYNMRNRVDVRDLDVLLQNDPCLLRGDEHLRVEALTRYAPSCVELALAASCISSYHSFIPVPLAREPQSREEWNAELKQNGARTAFGSIMAPEEDFDRVYDEGLAAYMREGFEEVMAETREICQESR